MIVTYPLVAIIFTNKRVLISSLITDTNYHFFTRKNCKYKLLSLATSSYFIPRISSRYSIIFTVNTNIKCIHVYLIFLNFLTYLLTFLLKCE